MRQIKPMLFPQNDRATTSLTTKTCIIPQYRELITHYNTFISDCTFMGIDRRSNANAGMYLYFTQSNAGGFTIQ